MTTAANHHDETPGRRLRRFADAAGLSAAEVGRLLAPEEPASDAAVFGWYDGKVPSKPFRDAIETLTQNWPAGPIRAEAWGLTKTETRDFGRVEGVKALPWPPSPAVATEPR